MAGWMPNMDADLKYNVKFIHKLIDYHHQGHTTHTVDASAATVWTQKSKWHQRSLQAIISELDNNHCRATQMSFFGATLPRHPCYLPSNSWGQVNSTISKTESYKWVPFKNKAWRQHWVWNRGQTVWASSYCGTTSSPVFSWTSNNFRCRISHFVHQLLHSLCWTWMSFIQICLQQIFVVGYTMLPCWTVNKIKYIRPLLQEFSIIIS